MDKNIRVEIRGEDESAQEFVKAWRRAEAAQPAEEPLERLYFQDLGTLLQVLTPRRLELLKALHGAGPESVRALAKRLKRDYKNVHRDVHALEQVGLLVRTADKRLTAPWEKVVAEIRLAA
ncbi:MAG TPA: helix-turn-helix domain-containing protein [Geobacteraceae bacterium]|nr:helix-turn-helix domain-containing protein [Geobacteraceae bacterium]